MCWFSNQLTAQCHKSLNDKILLLSHVIAGRYCSPENDSNLSEKGRLIYDSRIEACVSLDLSDPTLPTFDVSDPRIYLLHK